MASFLIDETRKWVNLSYKVGGTLELKGFYKHAKTEYNIDK